MNLHERVNHNMTNHPPVRPEVVVDFEYLRVAAKEFGHLIVDLVPQSREQSEALTLLETCLMWAVAGIARNQEILSD